MRNQGAPQVARGQIDKRHAIQDCRHCAKDEITTLLDMVIAK
jgi:hypothetical protein